MSGEFAWEPVRGLPAHLPEGETVLWQGAPAWKPLALTALWVRPILIWFTLVVVARLSWQLGIGADGARILGTLAWSLTCAGASAGLLALYARATERTTVYTITNRRVVLRIGVALDKTVNVPFSKVTGAAVRTNGDDSGDIALSISDDSRIGFVVLWPHVRTVRGRPEPVLKALPDAERVGALLADAWMADAAGRGVAGDRSARDAEVRSAAPKGRPAHEPAGGAVPGLA